MPTLIGAAAVGPFGKLPFQITDNGNVLCLATVGACGYWAVPFFVGR